MTRLAGNSSSLAHLLIRYSLSSLEAAIGFYEYWKKPPLPVSRASGATLFYFISSARWHRKHITDVADSLFSTQSGSQIFLLNLLGRKQKEGVEEPVHFLNSFGQPHTWPQFQRNTLWSPHIFLSPTGFVPVLSMVFLYPSNYSRFPLSS